MTEKFSTIFTGENCWKFFSHFLVLKNFILTYQLLFFCRQKWKVISRDHELWGVKFDLKTGFQTLLSFFLVGLFSRPRYQKYSPWTGEFILGHRGTHKRVRDIQKWPNNRQKIENFTKYMLWVYNCMLAQKVMLYCKKAWNDNLWQMLSEKNNHFDLHPTHI